MYGGGSGSSGANWLRESGWGGGFEESSGGGGNNNSSSSGSSGWWGNDSGGGGGGWWDEPQPQQQLQQANADAEEGDGAADAADGASAAASAAASDSERWTASSLSAWRLETPAALKTPFKPPGRAGAGVGARGSKAAAAAAAAAGPTPSASAAVDSHSQSAAAAPTAPAPAPASQPTASPFLKPIRFVKAKYTLQLEEGQQQSTAAVADESAAGAVAAGAIGKAGEAVAQAPGVVKVAGRVSLLARSAPPAASRLRSTAPSLRAAPSLLAPFKKPGAATAPAAAAAASSVTPSAGAAAARASSSSLTLAHVYSCSYCLAGRKKKNWREGYVHLFRSALAASSPAAAAGPGGSAAAAAAAPAAVAPAAKATSFIKSHLYSERGHLIDEQIGSSVMQYEEAATRPAKSALQRLGWDEPLGGKKDRKRRRGDEVEDDDDEEDSEEEDGGLWGPFGGGGGPAASHSPLSSAAGASPASAAPPLLSNSFAQGEVVILGRFECQLEEEISYEEFDKCKKLTTGELSAAPLSRFSGKTSIAITGPPLPPDNRGHILLSAMGLAANGGVIGRNERAATAIKEPITMVWHVRDSRPGIGFKEKPKFVAPPSQRGGRGGRGGRHHF